MGKSINTVSYLLIIAVLPFLMYCKKEQDLPLDSTTGLVRFGFDTETTISGYRFTISPDKENGSFLVQNADSLPFGTDVTKLKASFQTINSLVKVKINGIVQTSGVTVNDFSKPVTYEVYAENGNLKKYKVILIVSKKAVATGKYIFLNSSGFDEATVQIIASTFGSQINKSTAVGLGVIISLLNGNPNTVMTKLNTQLSLSLKYGLPIMIQPDVEQWWDYRSDLWNWWNPGIAGYNPDNKQNVEWTDWNSDAAIKICWRNWGRQIRVKPAPNLMSTQYIQAWKNEMVKCTNAIKTWYDGLPQDKKFLFCGIKVGWESAIGMGSFYYPDGNSFLNLPESNDPVTGIDANNPPSRGVQTIGFAAVKTAGIADKGIMTEQMQAEVVRRHLESMSKTVFDQGIPRDHIFTHCGGWKEGEALYQAALNTYSCPGWSFYKYASDPAKDLTAMNALGKSDASYWAAVEWLLQGNKTKDEWVSALRNTLGNKTRFLTIFNWDGISANANAIQAIKEMNK